MASSSPSGRRMPMDFLASTVTGRPIRFCSTNVLLFAMTFV